MRIRTALAAVSVVLAYSAVAAVVVATTGAAAATTGQWTQSDGNPAADNYQLSTGGLHVGNAGDLTLAWTRIPVLFGDRIGGAAVAGGRLHIAYGTGTLESYDARTGTVLGTVVVPDRELGQLAVVDGVVYARTRSTVTTGNYLASYTPAGVRRWEAALTDEVVTPFAVGGGLVLVTTGPKCRDICTGFSLRAFRADTGAPVWTSAVAGDAYSYARPTIVGDTALVTAFGPVPGGGGDSIAFAYRLATGAPRWRRSAPGFDVAGWGGRTYTAGYEGLCSYATATGTRRWCVEQAGEYFDEIAFGPGALYADSPGDAVLSLDPDTGAQRWRRSYDRGYELTVVRGNLVSGGGVVYAFVSHQNFDPDSSLYEVVAMRAADGAVLRRITVEPGASHDFRLMLAAGRLYLVGDDRLWAFSP